MRSLVPTSSDMEFTLTCNSNVVKLSLPDELHSTLTQLVTYSTVPHGLQVRPQSLSANWTALRSNLCPWHPIGQCHQSRELTDKVNVAQMRVLFIDN